MIQKGSAYIFERNIGGTNAWGQVKKLTASDGTGSDQFGYSVSVNGDVALSVRVTMMIKELIQAPRIFLSGTLAEQMPGAGQETDGIGCRGV